MELKNEEMKSGFYVYQDIKIEEEEIKLEELSFENEIKEKIKSHSSDFRGSKTEKEESKFVISTVVNEIKEEEIEFEEEDFWPEEKVDWDGNSFCSFSEEKFPSSTIFSIDNHDATKMKIKLENVKHVGWERSLKDGNYQQNKVKQKPFHCDICECYFDWKYQLINHAASVHGKEKPFKCPECIYSFSVKGDLTKHVKSVHRKEKPFKCTECDYLCSRKDRLVMHVKSRHRKKKPFKCTERDYSCSVNGNITMHDKLRRKIKTIILQ